jgi:hypothetical protein
LFRLCLLRLFFVCGRAVSSSAYCRWLFFVCGQSGLFFRLCPLRLFFVCGQAASSSVRLRLFFVCGQKRSLLPSVPVCGTAAKEIGCSSSSGSETTSEVAVTVRPPTQFLVPAVPAVVERKIIDASTPGSSGNTSAASRDSTSAGSCVFFDGTHNSRDIPRRCLEEHHLFRTNL